MAGKTNSKSGDANPTASPSPPPVEKPAVLYCDDCGQPGAKLFGVTHWKLDSEGKRSVQESRLNRRLCATHEGFRRQEKRITLNEPDPEE